MQSTMITEITRGDLTTIETPPNASITNVKQLSSYNWIEAPTPTIAVPGSPSRWSPPAFSRRLPKDSGLVYIAQNAARHPESPLEPLFRSIYISEPSFDISSTDIVSDRNNIRKLLAFVDPSTSRNGLDKFTIKLEVVGNTVIFSRNESATYEVIGPHEFKGYGHEFEKAYTLNMIQNSTGHHRIISYNFGGHNFIIRHETDGYAENLAADPDRLSTVLEAVSLSSAASAPVPARPGSKLSVKKEGQIVPVESTIEIKTRVQHKHIPIGEAAAQLWVSQTPKLVRAYHNRVHLRKLAGLISRILDDVKGSVKGGSAVMTYDPICDRLEIRKAEGMKMLPEDLYSKWTKGEGAGVNVNTASETPLRTHA